MRAKEGRGSGRARGRFDAATGATSSGINILQSSRETPSEKGHRIFRKLKAGLVSTPQLRPLLCKAFLEKVRSSWLIGAGLPWARR